MLNDDKIKVQIEEIINNQLNSNNPPETKITLVRLQKEGISKQNARTLIGHCLMIELIDALTNGRPYNHARYIRNLSKLPEEPRQD